jgi:hypothetical protein
MQKSFRPASQSNKRAAATIVSEWRTNHARFYRRRALMRSSSGICREDSRRNDFDGWRSDFPSWQRDSASWQIFAPTGARPPLQRRVRVLPSALSVAAPEEKSEQHGANNRNDDRPEAAASGREKREHAIGRASLSRRLHVPRRVRAKKPINESSRKRDRN